MLRINQQATTDVALDTTIVKSVYLRTGIVTAQTRINCTAPRLRSVLIFLVRHFVLTSCDAIQRCLFHSAEFKLCQNDIGRLP
jgi:hypothetical protein